MKAFLIDPYAIMRNYPKKFYAAIREEGIVEIDIDEARSEYLNEPEVHTVNTMTSVMLSTTNNQVGNDCMFLDDDGLANTQGAYFIIKNYPKILAGKALVVGTTASGETIEPEVATLEWLRNNVIIGHGTVGYSFSYDRFIIGDMRVDKYWLNVRAWINHKDQWAQQ